MKLARVPIAASIAALSLLGGGTALAQNTVVLTYACNIGGAQAQLTTEVTQVGDGAGGYNLQTTGQLVSQAASYSFTGENAYADFTNLNANERFRVQFVVQGNQLLLIVNPQGPGPVQYVCQRTG